MLKCKHCQAISLPPKLIYLELILYTVVGGGGERHLQNPVVVEHHHFVYRPVEVVITPTSPFLGGLNLLCRRGAFKFLVEIESTQVFPSLGEPISEEKPNLLTSLLKKYIYTQCLHPLAMFGPITGILILSAQHISFVLGQTLTPLSRTCIFHRIQLVVSICFDIFAHRNIALALCYFNSYFYLHACA